MSTCLIDMKINETNWSKNCSPWCKKRDFYEVLCIINSGLLHLLFNRRLAKMLIELFCKHWIMYWNHKFIYLQITFLTASQCSWSLVFWVLKFIFFEKPQREIHPVITFKWNLLRNKTRKSFSPRPWANVPLNNKQNYAPTRCEMTLNKEIDSKYI